MIVGIAQQSVPFLGGTLYVAPLGTFFHALDASGQGSLALTMPLSPTWNGLDTPFHGVLIRAPVVERVGDGVDILAAVDGRPVLCASGAVMVASFHPELSGDARIHQLFFEQITVRRGSVPGETNSPGAR